MADGDPEETRAFARLPGLDLAVVHRRGGGRGTGGGQMLIALQVAPHAAGGLGRRSEAAADPFLLWMGLAQAAGASWLTCLAAAAAAAQPPWFASRD